MIIVFIAALLATQAPSTEDPAVYCLETSGNAVPLDLKLSELARLFRSKYAYSSRLNVDKKKSGTLEFRGGYENIETVTYIVDYERDILLKGLQVKQIVEESTLVGDPMCGWTAYLILDQQ